MDHQLIKKNQTATYRFLSQKRLKEALDLIGSMVIETHKSRLFRKRVKKRAQIHLLLKMVRAAIKRLKLGNYPKSILSILCFLVTKALRVVII